MQLGGSCVHDLFNASIVREIFSFNPFNVLNYLIYLFFMRCFARVAVLRRAHRNVHGWAIILLTVTQHVAARAKQGRGNVTHTSHNKRFSYRMFFSAPLDKLGVVAAAGAPAGPSWGQVQSARCHVICVHVGPLWQMIAVCGPEGCSHRHLTKFRSSTHTAVVSFNYTD